MPLFNLDGMTVNTIGDPHLGRSFKTGVPLHRLGDREAMVWKEFERQLGLPADLTIIMICHSEEELDAASDVVWVCNGGVKYRGDKEALKNRLVGAFHAYLQLDDSDHINAIYRQLERESATLRLSRPSSNEISVYGTQALDPLIRALIGHVAFQHFEFGPTHYRDMLHLCAQGELDA